MNTVTYVALVVVTVGVVLSNLFFFGVAAFLCVDFFASWRNHRRLDRIHRA